MQLCRLSDGRTLEYVELGDPDGVAVLHFHGTPNTAGSAALWDDAARRNHVRLIAVSRPGYGDSTTTRPGLDSVAHDVVALADELRIERFALLGISGGGPFALALASHAPERTHSAVVAGGPGSYQEVAPEQLEDEDREAIDLLAAGEVEAAVSVVTAGVARSFDNLSGLSETEFEAAFVAMLPADEPDYFADHPADRTVLMSDMRRALAKYDGFVRDNLSWCGPWDVDLGGVRCPVTLSYGDADHMAPVAHGAWLKERLPSAELTIHRGAGHGEVSMGLADWQLSLLVKGQQSR